MKRPFDIISKDVGPYMATAICKDLEANGFEIRKKPRSKGPVVFDREALCLKFIEGSDTSLQAAQLTEQNRLSMIKRTWLILAQDGPRTCSELERIMTARHQTVSARLCDLQALGFIEDSGERRLARKGGNTTAVVWRAVLPGHLDCSLACDASIDFVHAPQRQSRSADIPVNPDNSDNRSLRLSVTDAVK